MTLQPRLRSIMRGDDRTVTAGLARLGLTVVSALYRPLIFVRNKQFDMGLRSIAHLGRPTISVGNLTTGGTGKTPVVIDLARRLVEMGAKPAVLMRGYKSDEAGSDEARVVGESFGSAVAVGCGASRLEAAQRVRRQQPDVDLFLLDDAFQHRQAGRDLDLVLVDATEPFGFDHLLPRGMLREPRQNIRRADAVIVTRADQVSPSRLRALDDQIHELSGRRPVAHAACRWSAFKGIDGTDQPLGALSDASVVGVCGVGNPEAFERSLKNHAGRVLAVHSLPDHHRYDAGQLRNLLSDALDQGAQLVVTTHKDVVKWRPLIGKTPAVIPVCYPVLTVRYLDGQAAVESLLRRSVAG